MFHIDKNTIPSEFYFRNEILGHASANAHYEDCFPLDSIPKLQVKLFVRNRVLCVDVMLVPSNMMAVRKPPAT